MRNKSPHYVEKLIEIIEEKRLMMSVKGYDRKKYRGINSVGDLSEFIKSLDLLGNSGKVFLKENKENIRKGIEEIVPFNDEEVNLDWIVEVARESFEGWTEIATSQVLDLIELSMISMLLVVLEFIERDQAKRMRTITKGVEIIRYLEPGEELIEEEARSYLKSVRILMEDGEWKETRIPENFKSLTSELRTILERKRIEPKILKEIINILSKDEVVFLKERETELIEKYTESKKREEEEEYMFKINIVNKVTNLRNLNELAELIFHYSLKKDFEGQVLIEDNRRRIVYNTEMTFKNLLERGESFDKRMELIRKEVKYWTREKKEELVYFLIVLEYLLDDNLIKRKNYRDILSYCEKLK